MIKYFIILSIIPFACAHDQEAIKTEKLVDLANKYPIKQNAYDYITANETSIFNFIDNGVSSNPTFYGVCKPDVTRFEGKKRLDDVIAKTNIKTVIKTPEKSFYLKKLPDGSYDFNKYCVLSHLVEGSYPDKITHQEMLDLFKVFVEAQYKDVTKENLIKTQEGHYYIVDTALNSFSKLKGQPLKAKIASRLLENFKNGELEQKTITYLDLFIPKSSK